MGLNIRDRSSIALSLRVGSFQLRKVSRIAFAAWFETAGLKPLSRSAMLSMEPTQPISAPLQSSLRFLPDLLTAPPSTPLTVDLSPFWGTIRVTAQRYPDPLRRIHYIDAEKDSRLTFLTNNFLLPALTIAQLYRARWKVELFFRWIKQHLRIKAFYGTSENAVKTQAWVALSIYVLVAIAKKQLGLDLSLYKILQILSVTVFEKTPILEGFSNFNDGFTDAEPCNQLNLFDF